MRVQFIKEQLSFTGDDTAMTTLLLSVTGAFAEVERSLIRERQREGIALARKRGAYRVRARALNAEQVAQLRQRVASGTPKAALARELGVSRETVYQYLRAVPQAERGADHVTVEPGLPERRGEGFLSVEQQGRYSRYTSLVASRLDRSGLPGALKLALLAARSWDSGPGAGIVEVEASRGGRTFNCAPGSDDGLDLRCCTVSTPALSKRRP